ncbi:MAG: arginine--tRNA ligase [Candidatus Omnitrophica bacterium]|nr:arginine--tRNA ligase [Candidatus Omnitrophota bacterium]
MKKNIQPYIVDVLKDALKKSWPDLIFKEEPILDLPSDSRFGELSSNIALRLSKPLKKSPRDIALLLLENVKKELNSKGHPLRDCVKEVKAEGAGFINFYLADRYFQEELGDIYLKREISLRQDYGRKKPVLIEFVSANPTGPLSVAHARQAVVGDVLANIMLFLGFKVKREYYLNDEGNQINILGNSIALRLKELSGENIEFPEDHYQGEYIRDIAREIKAKGLESRDLCEYGTRYILNVIKKELADFGVKFDYWYSQKSLRKSGKIKKVFSFLRKKDFLFEQEGALWFKSTIFGDDKDRVVIKSDGSYTYLAPDIAYHREKFRRGFRLLINLWGPDHHGYINRLKAAVMALGKPAGSLSVIIVQLASIFREGKPVQMSTRRGQYITLREILDEVGKDASRFFFLMRRTSSHLDFDLEVAKKQTAENPVYYTQYAYARISGILRNCPGKIDLRRLDLSLLKEKEEIALIKKLWQFSFTLEICLKTQDPYMLTVYLQELAESFHCFYDQHRVLGQEAKLTQARVVLLEATKVVLSEGLKLLGISRPEKM